MADYLQFSEIVGAVERSVKQYQSSMQSLVKSMINQVYLTEVLQADNLYPLFWLLALSDNRRSVASCDITGITQANPGVVSASHSLVAGDIVTLYDPGGMTELNYRTTVVGTVVAGTSFQLLDLDGTNINTTGFTAYTSGGTVIHRGITLSPSVEMILSNAVKWHDEDVLNEITPAEIEGSKDYDWWTDSTARPFRYLHKKSFLSDGSELDRLLWFPGAQDTYYLRYWYQKIAARLSADGDVPQLPWKFHDTIVSGAITRLAENNVQVENAVIWPKIYAAQLGALKTYNRKWWENHSEEIGVPYLL